MLDEAMIPVAGVDHVIRGEKRVLARIVLWREALRFRGALRPLTSGDRDSRATVSSLGSFAGTVIAALRQNQDDWKSGAEALCAHDCARPSPTGVSRADAAVRKNPAEPLRRFIQEKSAG
jgi:hypothetical protein